MLRSSHLSPFCHSVKVPLGNKNMHSNTFPTFAKILGAAKRNALRLVRRQGTAWRATPWWPGDTLQTLQLSLLRVLAVAHSERLELAPLVRCLATEQRGRYRRVLLRLARRLELGATLVTALEQTPDSLSDDAILALRFGTQSGTLPATYAQLLQASVIQADSGFARQPRYSVAYWLALTVVMFAVITFLATVIVPTFEMIYAEFGMRPPVAFRMLSNTFAAIANYAWLWISILIGIVWLIWSGPSRRFFRRTVAARFFQPVAQLRRSELLRLLGTAVDAGRPLPGTLSTLARYHFDKHLRQKLLYARNEVEQGVDAWQSLTDAKLLTAAETDALATAPSNRVRAWILRRLAHGKQTAVMHRTAKLFALLEPVVVLCFAALVLWICYAFVSFLTHLNQALA